MDPRLIAICDVYGVFLRREAAELGYHDREIARLVARGVWRRVRHGAYVYNETWRAADHGQRHRFKVMAAMRQASTDVVASHVSGALMNEAPSWGLPLDFAHLTRTDARTGRKEAGVQQHRGVIMDGDVIEIAVWKVMSATRSALEVTTLAPVEPSLCVMDNLLHRGCTTPQLLRERYEASMELWPSTLTTDLVLRLADGRSESVGETRCRYLCWRCGIPAPTPQVEVYDERGRLVARVDLAWPEHGVFLEFDGREKYFKYRRDNETLDQFILREKRREEIVCAITGWTCIRVTWADLANPELVAMRIRNLLFAGSGVA